MQLRRAIAASTLLFLVAGCGGGGGGGGGPPAALNITIAAMQGGVIGTPYSQTITVSGGTGARSFSVSSGNLPAGLILTTATGVVSGSPSGPAGTANFTITVVDSGAPQQSDSQALSIAINSVVMRNDTIGTATPLTNGTFAASISPSGHPNSVLAPDEDYYRITTAASTVTVDIDAQVNGSPLDSVIELVAANGGRLNTCIAPAFVSPCVHDDEVLGTMRDSFLEIQIAGATTFYVHVMDFRSDARPDLLYDITISGVN